MTTAWSKLRRTPKAPKPKPLYKRPGLAPTPEAPKGALRPCIACGALVRWALRSCFDCNRVLVVEQREKASSDRRFLYFT